MKDLILVGGIRMESLDWKNLGFEYRETKERFVCRYKDGNWDEGVMSTDATVHLNECATILQYGQACFEGLKAYTAKNGKIVLFRPDLNAQRLQDSCKRLVMPELPIEKFLEGVKRTVKANFDMIPPYGTGATFYLRPCMFGSGATIGIQPSPEFEFRVFGSPVGPYYKGEAKSLVLRVCEFDRAAPHGTGHIKAGLNYAMSLYAIVTAHEEGYDENMYLDAATRTMVEEAGGANFIFVTKDNQIVTPKSDSILPSITRRSLLHVAKEYFGYEVQEREVPVSELSEFKEAALCGTAAVLSPIKTVVKDQEQIHFEGTQNGLGEVTRKLYETLIRIQMCEIEAPEGWIYTVEK